MTAHYIYKFTNIKNGMIYVGETNCIPNRFFQHKKAMTKPVYTGRHSHVLIDHFNKYDVQDFTFEILEKFEPTDFEQIYLLESKYIDSENSLYPAGYNCKKYTVDGWLFSKSYCDEYSQDISGDKNPNFGNEWSGVLKKHLSDIKKKQHADGEIYNQEWRDKIGKSNSEKWASYSDEKVDEIMTKQSLSSSKYYYLQKTKDGKLVKRWETIREILKANPTYRRQGIYSNVNGYKGSHRGFVWEKVKR